MSRIVSHTFPQNSAWHVCCLWKLLKFGECEQCLAAQHELVMVDTGRSVEFKRSTTRNDILTVFFGGFGCRWPLSNCDSRRMNSHHHYFYLPQTQIHFAFCTNCFPATFCFAEKKQCCLKLLLKPSQLWEAFLNAAPDPYCTCLLQIWAICWFS